MLDRVSHLGQIMRWSLAQVRLVTLGDLPWREASGFEGSRVLSYNELVLICPYPLSKDCITPAWRPHKYHAGETHLATYLHMKTSHNFRWNALSQQTLTSYSPIFIAQKHQWSAIVHCVLTMTGEYLTEFHSLGQISLMMRGCWSWEACFPIVIVGYHSGLLPHCDCWLSLRPEMWLAKLHILHVAASSLWQWSSQIYWKWWSYTLSVAKVAIIQSATCLPCKRSLF